MKKGTKKPSVKKVVKQKNPMATRGLFDHLQEIYAGQRRNYFDTLESADLKSYSIYMLNRFISMNPEQALVVNILQKYTDMPPGAHYQFLINVLPKRRQFNKYIKTTTDVSYEPWVIDRLAQHFEVSTNEAVGYLDIFYATDQNKQELRHLLGMYGTDEKLYKKLKL